MNFLYPRVDLSSKVSPVDTVAMINFYGAFFSLDLQQTVAMGRSNSLLNRHLFSQLNSTYCFDHWM